MRDIGAEFRELHKPGDPFTLTNAWDMGSAKVLTAMGAQAIGTTSNGHAFTLGRPDFGNVSRDEALSHAQDIISVTHLPVSGDLENGYGDAPEDVAETVRLAAEVGMAGCSIEDTDMADIGVYDFDLALERIKAGVAAARALSQDFVFVARADGMMTRNYGIDEAVRRLQAFDTAGADCLYAPLPPSMEDLTRICRSTQKPVNALAVGPFSKVSRAEFAAAGVGRISLGSGLARVAQGALIRATEKILSDGDFSDVLEAASSAEIKRFMTGEGDAL